MKTVKNNSKITAVITIIAFVFVNFVNIRPAEALGNSSLYFDPDSRDIDVGDSTTLDAVVDPGATPHQVSSVSLRITYDETSLELTDMTCSEDFSSELYANLPGVPDGTARIDCAVPGGEAAVTVDTVAATFSFTALAGLSFDSPVAFAVNSSIGADDELGVNVFDQDIVSGRALISSLVQCQGDECDPEEADTTPPTISNGTPSGELSRGTTTSTISVTTNENATCKYSTSSGVAYASMTGTFTTTGTTTHSFAGTGFSNGNGYRYYVRCQDSESNVNASDYTVSFSIDKSSSKKKEVKKTKRKIYNSQKKLKRGDVLVQRGKRFSKNSTVMLYFSKFGGGYYAPMSVKTSGSGTFSVAYKINKPAGKYSWYALDVKTGKKSKTKTYQVR